ncbi:hypothetical protein ILUMI_05302 [Ignelater luminosus]|uniref:Uncharacterized protein n=1 Tax=Ignelater luminosus TaxID=2038154 RepID=A0A8K0GGI1_IGNLU|nr:hypothetical protein ILUMI_05302 [Ignelater luminosus]
MFGHHSSGCSSCNNWKHSSRKVSPNPVPHFNHTSASIPITPSTTTMHEATMTETVKDLITDAVTNFVSTSETAIADTTLMSSTENVNLLSSTDFVGLSPVDVTFNEVTDSNVTTMFGIMESTTSSSMINTMQNGSMTIDGILTNGTEKNDTILTTISEFASSTMNSIMSTVNITPTMSEAPTSLSHNTPESASHHHPAMHPESDHNLLYVILIIILAVLILIGIILLLIYIRYRKASHRLHNYYDVHPTNNKNNSNDEQQETRDCINDIYVYQQQC